MAKVLNSNEKKMVKIVKAFKNNAKNKKNSQLTDDEKKMFKKLREISNNTKEEFNRIKKNVN